MNSRKSSIGANNPTSWMDNFNSNANASQPLNANSERKGLIKGTTLTNTLREMQTSASRSNQKHQSNFTSQTLKVPGLGLTGPTSNLRNLAGHLLMSGSSGRIQGGGSVN